MVFVIALSSAADVRGAEAVGDVSRIVNTAEAVTEGISRSLETGAVVHLDDQISTGAGARLEITFADGTQLTLGENAALVVDAFVFQPAADEAQLFATVEGAFRFVSGQIGTVANNDLRVTTPFAVIGIRGTDFWAGPIDAAFGVFLVDGAVSVTTTAGQATLDQPGSGTNVTSLAEAPGPVTQWPDDKVVRALDAVAFE
jgi:hypothetical protein